MKRPSWPQHCQAELALVPRVGWLCLKCDSLPYALNPVRPIHAPGSDVPIGYVTPAEMEVLKRQFRECGKWVSNEIRRAEKR